MKKGDIFSVNMCEILGHYMPFGQGGQRDKETSFVSHGAYFIKEETSDGFVVAEIYSLSSHMMLYSKHSYYVRKEDVEGKQISGTVPGDALKAKRAVNG